MKRNKVIAGIFCAALVVSPVFAEDWDDTSLDDLLGEFDEEVEEVVEDTLDAVEDLDIEDDVADIEDEDFDTEDETVAEDDAVAAEDAPEAEEDSTVVRLSDDVKKLARFNPVLNIRNIKKTKADATITVTTPKGVTTEGSAHKAYPHGSTFTVTEGVSFRLLFAPASYLVVNGPAVFSLNITENNRKAEIDVKHGDMNIRVAKIVKPDQVTLKTPIGNFESLVGIFNLRANATDDGCDGCDACGDVIFRTATGSARFVGTGYKAVEILDNNAFRSQLNKQPGSSRGAIFNEEVSGRIGVFNLGVATHAGAEDQEVQMLPSSKLRFMREKPVGSKNWVVTIMGFHSDGSIKSYHSYVENREEPIFWIPEQIALNTDAEETEEAVEAEEEAYAEEETYSEDYPEEMGDFDDELL